MSAGKLINYEYDTALICCTANAVTELACGIGCIW